MSRAARRESARYCAVFTAFILLTGSSSALALMVLGGGMMAVLATLRAVRASMTTIALTFVVVPAALGAVGLGVYDWVLAALGRDPTLTGRTLLWAWGLDVALDRPLLGWGYMGYNGTEMASRAAMQFEQFENYAVPHFHSSYIQFFVEAGFIFGSAIIATYYGCVMVFANRYVKSGAREDAMMCLSLMWVSVAGFFIHVMGRYNDLSMVLFLYLLGFHVATRRRRSIGHGA